TFDTYFTSKNLVFIISFYQSIPRPFYQLDFLIDKIYFFKNRRFILSIYFYISYKSLFSIFKQLSQHEFLLNFTSINLVKLKFLILLVYFYRIIIMNMIL